MENDEVKTEETQVPEERPKQEDFDYRKLREDRVIKNTEKRILKELGESSFENIKAKLKSQVELQKELDIQKNNGRKLNVYSAGFDDQFVDFVAHDVGKNLKEDEKFEDALTKYKKNHPQFLRGNSKIQFSTAPDFENKPNTQSFNQKMNEFFKRKTNTF